MFALVDCNNFYASCERLFRPDLQHTPIVVLSNNDGCVIARSNEAKALGVPMGVPYYQIKDLVKQHRIAVFSSNYTLYGDLSQRVMSLMEAAWPEVEIYSIDEAFLDLSTLPQAQHTVFCEQLQRQILRCAGIPTSIGIGPSKTLAKAANFLAKKKLKIPVFNINGQTLWLEQVDVSEVWGIGRQWAAKLQAQGLHTAADLAQTDPQVLKKRYSVVLMRTALELRGLACAGLEVTEPKQSIMSSKSFGHMQTQFAALAEALSSHAARACEKARREGQAAQRVTVFIRSNVHRQDLPQYVNHLSLRLIHPTHDTREITAVAKGLLRTLYRPNIAYKKIGLILEELQPENTRQQDLFHPFAEEQLVHSTQLMSTLDAINTRFGRGTLRLAAEGYAQVWKMRAEMRSPCYTTRWTELAQVN
ncbi:MAG: Y-family DNA polymerase [Legionella sp.]|nr:Y-family DNA polymerase [Legionella sp.]